MSDGCLNVGIVTPDGAAYYPSEFDQLKERAGIALGTKERGRQLRQPYLTFSFDRFLW
jgi:hypothetical protein